MIDYKQIARQCFQDEANAISGLEHLLDDNFDKAVEMIYHCKGKIVVTGVGKSGHIGSKIAATLASTGTPAFFLNPLDAYHGDLGMLSQDDVVLAISYSGATDELLRFIPIIKAKHISIIGMSANSDSPLGHSADIHLNIRVNHEADKYDIVPTSSTTATLAMGDALACALMEVRQFRPTDFAMLHPGGDLGKRLSSNVEDIMVSENLPFILPTDTMQTAIDCITKGTLGVAIVVENGVLHGIITDGDVRRAMQRYGQDFFNTPASEVMSPKPKTILRTAKIAEAGTIMNNNSIHTLIVLNPDNTICGIIDSFSCLPGTRAYH